MIYRAEGDPRKKKFWADNRLHSIVKGRWSFENKMAIVPYLQEQDADKVAGRYGAWKLSIVLPEV